MLKYSVAILVAVLLYLTLWPVPVTPVAWKAPENQGFTGDFRVNDALSQLSFISTGAEYGPEDLAIDSKGVIYASMHSGMIMKLPVGADAFQPWVSTQGRPLGIEMDARDHLIVADAYLGLLSVDPQGKVSVLTNTANGIAIDYADDLDIADDGKIYFSDASVKFGAKQNGGTLPASLLDIMEHAGHGRLLVYDPQSKQTEVLATDIDFANGIAVSHDQQAVLINETGTYRVLRYHLFGERQGSVDVVIDNLPGFPDNIARAEGSGYWLGFKHHLRSKALDSQLSDSPFLRKVVQRLPRIPMRPKAQHYGHVVKIDDNGKVMASLQDPTGSYPLTNWGA